MTGHLDDLASDFSRFHGIRDAGALPSRVFLRLAERLPAYGGVMAVRARAEQAAAPAQAPRRGPPGNPPPRYTPRTAESAPPATAATLAALNTQLGAQWFTHRTVSAEGGD